jgi:hypothetical protein
MSTKCTEQTIQKTAMSFFLVASSIISGCASFQGNNLNPVKTFPQTQAKRSVDVDATFEMRVNKVPSSFMKDAAEKDFGRRIVKRLNRSKMFGEVSTAHPNPDLKVSVSFADLAENDLNEAFITGLTLYIVPSSHTDNFHLSARITDMRTGRQQDFRLYDSVTMTQQLFLLPLLPFKTQPYEANKCMNKMIDNLILEIHQAGFAEAPAPTVNTNRGDRQ